MIVDSKEVNKELARRSLIEFTKYTMPEYEASWHHELLAGKLDELVKGKIKKLIVSMPPRHGKSELVSRRFPAYLLGLDPHARVIATSYSSDLSTRMNRDVQRIIDSDLYRDLFPNTTLNSKNVKSNAKGSYLRNADIFEVVGHKGVYKSSGVGGSIVGLGGDFLVIDDYLKSWHEATSETIRNRNWHWFVSDLLTRAEKDARVLITATRWHSDDLIGKILNQKDHGYEVINLPAINDKGEALWPEKYDIDKLHEFKKQLGTKVFSSLYQQSPTIIGGSLIKPSWFKFYDKSILNMGYEYVSSWDVAESGRGDYTVGQIWARNKNDYYLVDMFRDKIETPECVRTVEAYYNKHNYAKNNMIENGGGGLAVYQHLQEKGNVPGLRTYKPREKKGLRLQRVAPMVEAGNIYLPENSEITDDFIYEVCNFGHVKHDDVVDSFTQAILQAFSHIDSYAEVLVDEERDELSEYYKMY